MGKRSTLLITFICLVSTGFAQFGNIEINFDTRLLRSDEKQEIVNLKNDIVRFFTNTTWDETYSDLTLSLIHI